MTLDRIDRMFLIFLFMKIDLHFGYKIALQTGASLSLEKSLNNKENWQIEENICTQIKTYQQYEFTNFKAK